MTMFDWLIEIPAAWFLSGLFGRPKKGAAAAAQRLIDYENHKNVMVPFRIHGAAFGEKVEYFEIRIFKGHPKVYFGWWDRSKVGDFDQFLGSMHDVGVQPDGSVDGTCLTTGGIPVRVNAQEGDLEILYRYYGISHDSGDQ
ncbi:MAG TPA: hypothetical protein VLL08_02580 [Kineosporiaceae bacterium]|nr:hypothetical protein [Kineosporiaceae bacterium]